MASLIPAQLPHLCRSALYVPGDKPRALEKARELKADILILDLEDAVAPEHKLQARINVLAALDLPRTAQTLAVRINDLSTPWGDDDYQALLTAAPDAIVLPKAESAQTVRELALGIPLWLTIETPLGVLRLPELSATPGVSALIAGTNDLSRALHAPQTPGREALLYALSQLVLCARAHSQLALDGVPRTLHDPQELEHSCVQGRALGFDGRSLIHPAQLETANRVYGVTDAEAAEARAVLAAWRQARAEGHSLAVHQNQLLEALHAQAAEELLARFEAQG